MALMLQAPFSTVDRILSRLGLERLLTLDPKPSVQRYEWERPADLIHIDVKSLARHRKVGQRSIEDKQRGASTASAQARSRHYTAGVREVLADEQQSTVISCPSRAVAWFKGQGIQCR